MAADLASVKQHLLDQLLVAPGDQCQTLAAAYSSLCAAEKTQAETEKLKAGK